MEKRFISGLASQWFGDNNVNKTANETRFANSIVFIKNDTDSTKGDAIFAQGAYFEMSNTADVENIINSYLDEGKNIDIAVDQETEKLVISAISLASIDKLAEVDKTKLVEAQAVKDALTTPVNLTLTLDNNGVASFAETFKTLEGGDKTATATTAVLKKGDRILFTNDDGLKISHEKITQATDVKTTETLSTADKSFDTVSYTVDEYGHVTGKTINTVTLPNTAFLNDNTTYTGENAINVAQPEEGSTQGKVTLKIDSTDKVLTQSASGLKTNLAIDYVSSTNKIRLTNGTDVISEFDASVFVKDSLLKDVEIVEANAEGTKGNYLKFTFETIDADGTGESVDSTKVIYVDVQEFYVKTTVSGDESTYSNVSNTGDAYKVSNVLGTISHDNTSNTITVSKDGLATVADIKTVVDGKFGEVKHNTVSAPKTEGEENYATVTPKDNADGSKNYEVVVSGIDAAIATATATGTVVNQGTNGTYNFVKTKDGLMTATDIAALMNESWEWGTI